MTAPIPISSNTSAQPNNIPGSSSKHSQVEGHGHGHHPSASSSSTLSSSPSPTTPFSPTFSLTTTSAAPISSLPSPSPNPNTNSAILKWATTFGSLGKSPTSPNILGSQSFNFKPQQAHGHNPGEEHDHHESHDAFEFGDSSDMLRSSWTGHTRRAVSMSNAPGSGALGVSPGTAGAGGVQGQSGISAMLAGFGGTGGVPGGLPSNSSGMIVGSPPAGGGGVIAENVAKGQGVLRRLSLGGAGRGRPQMISPTSSAAAVPTFATSSPQTNNPPPQLQSVPAPSNGSGSPDGGGPGGGSGGGLQVNNSATGGFTRGRRYSENPGAGRKRGVSPMGERLLRDHGHF